MEVADLIFADYAAANVNGKFTLVGAGFTEIFAQKNPCIHPLMFILVRFKVTIADIGKNKVEIRLVGERGNLFKAEFDIDVSDNHTQEQYIPASFSLMNTKFEVAGDYRCDVLINGQNKSNQILRVTIRELQPGL